MDFRIVLLIVLSIFLVLRFWPRDTIRQLTQDATDALYRGHYEDAVVRFSKLLDLAQAERPSTKRNDQLFVAAQGKAISLRSLERFVDALPLLEQAVELLEAGVKQSNEIVVTTWCELALCETKLQVSKTLDPLGRIENLLFEMRTSEQEKSLHYVRYYGQVALGSGEQQLARQLHELVNSLLEESVLPDVDLLVLSKLDLAHLHHVHGEYRRADALIEETVCKNYVDLEESTLLHMWFVIGTNAIVKGDYAKAVDCRRQTLDYWKPKDEPANTDIAQLHLIHVLECF